MFSGSSGGEAGRRVSHCIQGTVCDSQTSTNGNVQEKLEENEKAAEERILKRRWLVTFSHLK
jgi:hypothetical protein